MVVILPGRSGPGCPDYPKLVIGGAETRKGCPEECWIGASKGQVEPQMRRNGKCSASGNLIAPKAVDGG